MNLDSLIIKAQRCEGMVTKVADLVAEFEGWIKEGNPLKRNTVVEPPVPWPGAVSTIEFRRSIGTTHVQTMRFALSTRQVHCLVSTFEIDGDGNGVPSASEESEEPRSSQGRLDGEIDHHEMPDTETVEDLWERATIEGDYQLALLGLLPAHGRGRSNRERAPRRAGRRNLKAHRRRVGF